MFPLMKPGIAGIQTFMSSIAFFYRHPSLILLSLVPSSLRFYQMWNHLQTPAWMEVAVLAARLLLFLLMIALMLNRPLREFSRKDFWSEFGERCSVQFNRDWPGVFIAQLAVFIVLLYGLMNLLLQWATRLLLDPVIQLPGLQTEDRSAAHDALLFFLKNMSVIPLSMVYVLHMAGLRPRPNQNRG